MLGRVDNFIQHSQAPPVNETGDDTVIPPPPPTPMGLTYDEHYEEQFNTEEPFTEQHFENTGNGKIFGLELLAGLVSSAPSLPEPTEGVDTLLTAADSVEESS